MNSEKLHPDVLRELLAVLATVEVAFLPYRHFPHFDRAAECAVHERRDTYRLHGLPVANAGDGNAMARHRRIKVLRKAGLVETTGKTRSMGLRLTEAGDNFARLRAPTKHVFDDGPWALLERLANPLPTDVRQAGLIHERSLTGIAFDAPVKGSAFFKLEENASPLLCRGWVDSWSDACASIGYGVTKAGRTALAAGRGEVQEPDDYSSEIADWYIDLFCGLVRERESWKPENTSNVVVPLSAGLWGEARAVSTH